MFGFALAGHLLLWLGFITTALTTVFRLENEVQPWQTISWPIYGGCLAVGIVGIVFIRRSKVASIQQSANSQAGLQQVVDQLQECSTAVDELLAKRIDQLTCEQVLEIIDQQLSPLMLQFADQRMIIAARSGTAAYSSVMTEFASGERYLNRTWSAAADGYVDEVERSVVHANAFLLAAVRQAHLAVAGSLTQSAR